MNENLPTIMISGCLLGLKCRYDGLSKEEPELLKLLQKYRLVAFCPEAMGGLVQPRPPAEIQDGDGAAVLRGQARVVNRNGVDVTAEFIRGAEAVLMMVKEIQPEFVVLKAKSPSCGVGWIYDGTYSKKLTAGDGVTTALLRQSQVKVFSELKLLQSDVGSNLH